MLRTEARLFLLLCVYSWLVRSLWNETMVALLSKASRATTSGVLNCFLLLADIPFLFRLLFRGRWHPNSVRAYPIYFLVKSSTFSRNFQNVFLRFWLISCMPFNEKIFALQHRKFHQRKRPKKGCDVPLVFQINQFISQRSSTPSTGDSGGSAHKF